MKRKVANCIGVIVLLILLLLPVAVLLWISKTEQQQYVADNDIRIGEVAYGEICEAERTDLEETINISGKVVSNNVTFIELGGYTDESSMRLTVQEGDFISKGQLIGYYKGQKIRADKTGLVRSISLGTGGYIMLDSISNLVIEADCSDDKTYKILKQNNLKLEDENGNTYKVEAVNDAFNQEGQRLAYISADQSNKLIYGEKVENVKLFTGKLYKDILVIDQNCIYSNDNGKTYVRVISDSGIDEKAVKVSSYVGSYAVITGIDEGTKSAAFKLGKYCDAIDLQEKRYRPKED